ncbi:MAG: hypothetical protein AAF708_09365 [Deinococcota bacterium]
MNNSTRNTSKTTQPEARETHIHHVEAYETARQRYQPDNHEPDIHHIIKLVLVQFFRSFTRPLKVTSLPSHLEKTLEHAAQDYYLPGYTSSQHPPSKGKSQR